MLPLVLGCLISAAADNAPPPAFRAGVCKLDIHTQSGEPLAEKDVSVRQIAQSFLCGFALNGADIEAFPDKSPAALDAFLGERAKVFNAVRLDGGIEEPLLATLDALAEIHGMTVQRVLAAGDAIGPYAGHVAMWDAEASVDCASNDHESLPMLFAREEVSGVALRCGADDDLSAVRDLVTNKWSTRVTLKTDAKGRASFEGFYGDYEIVCDGHVWKIRFEKDGAHEFSLEKPPTPEPPTAFIHPFKATTPDEVRAWQEQIRARLLEIVSAQNPRRDVPLNVQQGDPADKGAYLQRDVTFTGNEGQPIEATLTVPHGQGPFPAMVCLHGHSGDRFKVHDPTTEYHGFAAEFARRGFVTLAPSPAHCDYAPNQLWNLMRVVDVLETLDSVDKNRIGVAGLSMGGEWTMWLAATDPRLKAAVVSGWMCTTDGVLSINNCPCWMPPGLVDLCDIADVHILIAPRPLLFESAISDGCFPIRYTVEGYRQVLRGYTALGAPLNVRQHTFPGGHAWNGDVAYGFIERALQPQAQPR